MLVHLTIPASALLEFMSSKLPATLAPFILEGASKYLDHIVKHKACYESADVGFPCNRGIEG
jgi:hypothetical protein